MKDFWVWVFTKLLQSTCLISCCSLSAKFRLHFGLQSGIWISESSCNSVSKSWRWSSLSLLSWSILLVLPVFAVPEQKLSAASIRELSSWKENPIDTRTRMIVGIIPYPTLSAKYKYKRLITHGKHLMDSNNGRISFGNTSSILQSSSQENSKHKPNQLNRK